MKILDSYLRTILFCLLTFLVIRCTYIFGRDIYKTDVLQSKLDKREYKTYLEN